MYIVDEFGTPLLTEEEEVDEQWVGPQRITSPETTSTLPVPPTKVDRVGFHDEPGPLVTGGNGVLLTPQRQCELCQRNTADRREQDYLDYKTGDQRVAMLCMGCIRRIFRGASK